MASAVPSRQASVRTGHGDLVSVVMANHRGADHLAAAMQSVLVQTHARLELLVCDDASDDDSVTIARGLAAVDPRVVVLEASANEGPSRARNAGLERARGDWIAIVDSDDLLHPERITRLTVAAALHRADMIADDLVPFGPGRTGPARTMFADRLTGTGIAWIDPATLLRGGPPHRSGAVLGYLKPLIARRALGTLRYDETLRLGEDFDFYLRLTLQGARFALMPNPTYLYRRHAASISHRLSETVLAPLLAAHEAIASSVSDGPLARPLAARGRALSRALRYAHLVAAIKARSFGLATATLLHDPALGRDLFESVRDRRRRIAAPVDLGPVPRRIVLGPAGRPLPPDLADAEAIAFAPSQSPFDLAVDLAGDGPGAARLCALWGSGPFDVIAVGEAGRRAVGYLPGFASPLYRSEE